jgi:hypothetical protein
MNRPTLRNYVQQRTRQYAVKLFIGTFGESFSPKKERAAITTALLKRGDVDDNIRVTLLLAFIRLTLEKKGRLPHE